MAVLRGKPHLLFEIYYLSQKNHIIYVKAVVPLVKSASGEQEARFQDSHTAKI